MNKNLIRLSLVVFVLIAVVGLIYSVRQHETDTHPKLTFNQSDITLVKTLKTSDGTILGNVNVTYIAEGVFTSLYIVKEVDGKNIIIYKINENGFFNVLGKEQAISKDNFYGYEFALVRDDYFVLHLVSANGNGASDDDTIAWNPNKNVFEIQRPQ